jgi:3-methyladenine DNA glycosylase Tag
MKENSTIVRCERAGKDPMIQKYHDKKWGILKFDDRRLFLLFNPC